SPTSTPPTARPPSTSATPSPCAKETRDDRPDHASRRRGHRPRGPQRPHHLVADRRAQRPHRLRRVRRARVRRRPPARPPPGPDGGDAVRQDARRRRVPLPTPHHQGWPQLLDDPQEAAPHCLWVQGPGRVDAPPGGRPAALVGSRPSTPYGEDTAMTLAAA